MKCQSRVLTVQDELGEEKKVVVVAFVIRLKTCCGLFSILSPLRRAQFYKSSEQGSVCVSPLRRAR